MAVRHHLRTDGRSALLAAAVGGSLKFYAATHVRDEVVEKLPELAPRWGWTGEGAMAAFAAAFAPWIRFVDVTGCEPDDARYTAIVDPDDIPTGILVGLLAPAVSLSRDRDLVDVHLAFADWLPSLIAGAARTEMVQATEAVLLLLQVAGITLGRTVSSARRSLGAPALTSVAVIAAIGILLAGRHLGVDRRRLDRLADAAALGIHARAEELLVGVNDQGRRLDAATVRRRQEATPFETLARLLALEPAPRSHRELAAAMKRLGVRVDEGWILNQLQSKPAFVARGRWGWTLGGTPHSA